ncbi:PAS domain S-box protein [Desulfosporosinus orientis]
MKHPYSDFILGIYFALVTMFIIYQEYILNKGFLYDFRPITMILSGFIGGLETAITAAIISCLYQFIFLGDISFGGILIICAYACLGCFLHHFKSNPFIKKLWLWAFIPGIALTGIVSDTIIDFVAYISFTSLAVVIILGFHFKIQLLLDQRSIYKAIMKSSPLDLIVLNAHGPIYISNHLKSQSHFQQNIERLLPAEELNTLYKDSTTPQHREIPCEDERHISADFFTFQLASNNSACLAIVNDVTERKKELEMLRRAKESFSKAFQLGPLMMSINSRADSRYIDVNQRFLETRGFKHEEVIGKTPPEIGVPESDYNKIVELILTKGSVKNFESSIATQSGPNGTCIISAEEIQIDDQECILFLYYDITEIKRMQTESITQLTERIKLEDELSQNNQLIADIINNMPDAFYVLDNRWRFTFVNKKVEELLLTRANLLNKVFWDINPQARGTLFDIYFHEAKHSDVPITFETPSFLRKKTWYQVAVYPSEIGLSVYYRDISEKKLADEQLLKTQKEMNNILESMTDCFFAINYNWIFTYINRAGEKFFDKSHNELLGKKITEVFNFDDITFIKFQEVMHQKRSVNFEVPYKLFNNQWIEIYAYPTETGLTAYFHDITSRKIAENEISRLDRLNLVGQLAAGIGHEIRNPMTTVRGYLQLLGSKPDYSAQKSTFELMISELDRANSIITEFLSLSQTKQTELELQNLNDILNNLYPLLEADAFTQNKQLCFQLGDLPYLKLNGKEITQLILNLTRNGLEAMQERGCLTVKSYVEYDQAILAIQDEGTGIPPENLKKIGTPFFTTKDKGTGLGLATCYRIAETHNARLDIDTSTSGTTFYLIFPTPVVQKYIID